MEQFDAIYTLEPYDTLGHVMSIPSGSELQWFLLTVSPLHEKKAADKLAAKGFEVFLPTYESRREWSDRIKIVQTPLFPSYVFCRYALKDRLAIHQTPGVISSVGAANRPVPLPDSDFEVIRNLIGSGYALEPAPRLTVGQRVRVRSGLAEIEGVLIEEGTTCRVIVNFGLLESAIAVTVPKEIVSLLK